MNSDYRVVGLMSGTSLDGLDIVMASFSLANGSWKYSIEDSCTFEYSTEWRNRLSSAPSMDGAELRKIDLDLGSYFGKCVLEFLSKQESKPDFISSHGHTIYHQPQIKLSLQIGSGNAISSVTNLPVIYDFRTTDVLLGGQGAPLVPIGDKLLFSEFDSCVNLGGIANLSFEDNGSSKAYDITPFNILLNHFANKDGQQMDKDGNLASTGNSNNILINFLSNFPYYRKNGPKSLSFEEIEEKIIRPIEEMNIENRDILRTLSEHFANVIADELVKIGCKKVLFTGGGVHNSFVMDLIKSKSIGIEVVIPVKELIDFKEALIFGLLGVLRVRGEVNVLSSVTGASKDSVSGSIIGPV